MGTGGEGGGCGGIARIMKTDRETEPERARAGAAGNVRGSVALVLRALPCARCQGIPQSTSLPCLHDRMIDLLYLQMNS